MIQPGGSFRIGGDPHSPRLVPMSEETIFAAALELQPGERAAYLARACGPDAALRRRVTAARAGLRRVAVPEAALERAARLCMALGTDGLRGEMTLIRAARAVASMPFA